MARATGKDHSQINLDIWADDDWLDLTPPAQHLYFVLWTSPELSYCGCGPWHPGRISAKAKGWTPAAVETAAVELSAEQFLIVDTTTEEFDLRSWIKHDGLWRSPNMAVSMANARAALASRILRGVVVHEVAKIKARNIAEATTEDPVSKSWEREAVKNLLSQKAIDPASLAPFTPTPTPLLTLSSTHGLTPPLTPPLTVNGGVGVNPASNPGPTPAPAPTSSSILQGGHQNPEGHQGDEPDPNNPPPNRCPDHPGGTGKPCTACGVAGKTYTAWTVARAAARRRELANCPSCDPKGWLLNDDGTPADHQTRCPAHDWETAHA